MRAAHEVGLWLISLVFWLSVAFPVLVSAFWPWWESWWGRNLVALEACIALDLLPEILIIYFHMGVDIVFFEWFQDGALALTCLVIIWRFIMTWQTQRAGRITKDEGRV